MEPNRPLLFRATVAQNMAELRLSRDAVVQRFEAELGRPVFVVEPQPDFHLDLGFTLLDDHIVLGDNSVQLGRPGSTWVRICASFAARPEARHGRPGLAR